MRHRQHAPVQWCCPDFALAEGWKLGMIALHAGVVELVDAPDSKSGPRKGVWVQVPPPAPPSPLRSIASRACFDPGL